MINCSIKQGDSIYYPKFLFDGSYWLVEEAIVSKCESATINGKRTTKYYAKSNGIWIEFYETQIGVACFCTRAEAEDECNKRNA